MGKGHLFLGYLCLFGFFLCFLAWFGNLISHRIVPMWIDVAFMFANGFLACVNFKIYNRMKP